MGFRATLNFRKFKVALNPMYRIFLTFAKSCVLSCLLNVDNCCGASEQQNKQDLKRIYRMGIRILEFITFYQNALHLTRVHCITFYQSALRHEEFEDRCHDGCHTAELFREANSFPRA